MSCNCAEISQRGGRNKLKLLILSDTHGFLKNAQNVIDRIGDKIDEIIHLGDHDEDAADLSKEFPNKPFYIVKGNNDVGNTPYELLEKWNGQTVLLTHGHRQRVYWDLNGIYYLGAEKKANAVFFGHTHAPVNRWENGMLLFNPGSISMPRSTPFPTFGIVDISKDGDMRGTIMRYSSKESFRSIQVK